MKKVIFLTLLAIGIIGNKALPQSKTETSKNIVKPALLVIDIQNAYLKMVPEAEKEIAMYYINALIELFRSNGYPVIRIYHFDKTHGPQQGTDEFEFPKTVLIKNEDPKIIKTYGDAFNKTDLDKVIKEQGSNTLFLCGLSAVGCVLSTKIGAENHDYKSFLIKDALMSHNSDFTNNIEDIFDAVGYDVVKLIIESSSTK